MVGTPFRKGQSGNPRGRPVVQSHIRALARAQTKSAFDRLKELAKSRDERVAFSAVQELLNRAWGRPAQPLKHSGSIKHVPAELSDADLARIAASGGIGAAEAEDGPPVTH